MTSTCTVTATSCLIGGLTPQDDYSVGVVAYDTADNTGNGSTTSAAGPFTPGPPAPEPVIANTTVTASGKVLVSWAGSGTIGATSWQVTSSPEGKTCTATAASTSCSVEGLSPTTAYTFTVTALGAGQTGNAVSAASSSITPGIPDKPTDVVVNATSAVAGGVHNANVMWMPATTGGTATSYNVTVAPAAGGSGATPTYSCTAVVTTTCAVTGLTAGQPYKVQVSANGVDTSAPTSFDYMGGSPSMPTSITPVVMQGDNITLQWGDPTYNADKVKQTGGLNTYTVVSDPVVASVTANCTNITTKTCAATGLTPGASYKFWVKALGGTVSNVTYNESYGIVGRPAAVSNLKIESVDSTKSKASWTLPTSKVPNDVLSLKVTENGATTDVAGCVPALSEKATECTFTTPVTQGTRAYWVRSALKGNSAFYTDSAKVTASTGKPDAPYIVGAFPAGANAVKVSFRRPAQIGAGIASYTVTSTPGNLMCTAAYVNTDDPTSCTVNALTAGTSYTFAVKALGMAGYDASDAATTSSVVAGPPAKVTEVKAEAGENGTAKVSWKGVANVPGLTITTYSVKSNPDGQACSLLATDTPLMCTLSGLKSGQKYTFTVMANTATAGSSEAVSNEITVAGTSSGVPSDVQATPSGNTLKVWWNGVAGAAKYQAMAMSGGKSFWCAAIGAENKVCTIRGLAAGTEYTVNVRALAADGTAGAWSTAIKATTGAALPEIIWPATSPTGGGLVSSGGYNLYRNSRTTITGYGFLPGQSVWLYFYTGTTKVKVGGATAKADGTFAAAITIPANAAKGGSRVLAGGWDKDGKVRWSNAYIKIW